METHACGWYKIRKHGSGVWYGWSQNIQRIIDKNDAEMSNYYFNFALHLIIG